MLEPGRRRFVHLIGGGGKTTLMFGLARRWAGEGLRVLTTTSTKILVPEKSQSERVVLGSADAVIGPLREGFKTRCRITAARSRLKASGKLQGFSEEELDRILDAGVADVILVEADGAAGRSLKAHEGHEPVMSARADLVVLVVGVDCLGKPMTDEHVHRAALFRRRLGRPRGSLITPEDVAAILFHEDGYLKKVPPRSEAVVFLSKAEGRPGAEALAWAIRSRDVLGRLHAVVTSL